MVFSSLSFIFLFLPALALLYFPVKDIRWRNAVLLAGSLFFYAWGEPKLVLIMLLSALIAYGGGLLQQRLKKQGLDRAEKAFFIASVTLILSFLFVFKYLDLAVGTLNSVTGLTLSLPNLRLPIGISFYTFQILSYVIDLHRGKVELQRNFFRLLLYVCLFPQLIAGPIVRYSTVESELAARSSSVQDIAFGTRRFIIGLSKKVLIANGAAQFAEIVYGGSPEVYGSLMYWLAALAFTLQIYFDFSGYSDMAIGLGRIFGFHFLENFDYPYTAVSVTDFWRRWHISLSSWFRDYVYIPMGGNRVRIPRPILTLLIVWGLTGLWHGASWNFVLWGLYYGILLILEKFLLDPVLLKLPKVLRWLLTFIVVNIGWVIFDLTDFSQMLTALRMMFSAVPTNFIAMVAANTGILQAALYILPGLIFMFPVGKLFTKRPQNRKAAVLRDAGCIALFLLSVVFILSSSYNPFIYFRF